MMDLAGYRRVGFLGPRPVFQLLPVHRGGEHGVNLARMPHLVIRPVGRPFAFRVRVAAVLAVHAIVCQVCQGDERLVLYPRREIRRAHAGHQAHGVVAQLVEMSEPGVGHGAGVGECIKVIKHAVVIAFEARHVVVPGVDEFDEPALPGRQGHLGRHLVYRARDRIVALTGCQETRVVSRGNDRGRVVGRCF